MSIPCTRFYVADINTAPTDHVDMHPFTDLGEFARWYVATYLAAPAKAEAEEAPRLLRDGRIWFRGLIFRNMEAGWAEIRSVSGTKGERCDLSEGVSDFVETAVRQFTWRFASGRTDATTIANFRDRAEQLAPNLVLVGGLIVRYEIPM